ncbi:hypothetical protein L1987_79453 [Smallanthus sonchifolius]|uniref:Uncharacterized protein n=1 Tax=Smallanthus sonchifolius TaxID=185202 RepID=A0ACB8ZGJ7_9ASTR|nr:hypothetical protein L1987_79453 [Smallanthus sonchifolius]
MLRYYTSLQTFPELAKIYRPEQRVLILKEDDFSFSKNMQQLNGWNPPKHVAHEPICIRKKGNTRNIIKYMEAIKGANIRFNLPSLETHMNEDLQGKLFDLIILYRPIGDMTVVAKILLMCKLMLDLKSGAKTQIFDRLNGDHKNWNLKELATSTGFKTGEAIKFPYRGKKQKQALLCVEVSPLAHLV